MLDNKSTFLIATLLILYKLKSIFVDSNENNIPIEISA